MAFRRRGRFRKKFGRRRFRGKRRAGPKRFARRVKRVIYRTLEAKKLATEFNQAFREGDATSRTTYINCPPSGLVQGTGGTQDDQVDGNQVWLKGMMLRGQVSMDNTTPVSNGCILRITAIWTKDQGSGFNGGFIEYNSTTTISTNPAQTAPNVNPRLFDISTAPGIFTGTGNVAPFDRTNVKVLKQWNYFVNPGADTIAAEASLPTIIKCYVPINRMIQFEDPSQLGLTTAPRRFKYGNYYFVCQVLASGTSGASAINDTILNGAYRAETYWRDI